MASNLITSSIALQAHHPVPRDSAPVKWTLKKAVKQSVAKQPRVPSAAHHVRQDLRDSRNQKQAPSGPQPVQKPMIDMVRIPAESFSREPVLKKVKIRIRVGDENETVIDHITQEELDKMRDLEADELRRGWKPWATEPNANSLRFPTEFRRKARRGKCGKSKFKVATEDPLAMSESPREH